MCGIIGVLDNGGVSKHAVDKALGCISHRGPDGTGYFEDSSVKLSMCRLAIVDIKTGQQPIVAGADAVALVFNGEIYNYQELRTRLISKGYTFRSSGDSEVIANLYLEYGPNFVKLLNGMFAICIWDKRHKKLFLYRDRVGKKPLWYSAVNGKIFFASEIKSLLSFGISKLIDFESLSDSLIFGFTSAPNSPFKEIKQVNPGSFVVFEDSKVNSHFYWSMKDVKTRDIGMEEAKFELLSLLESSVRYRLNAERELGVFLSGGVDSTLVASIAQSVSNQKIKTFTAGFDSEEFDETKFASGVANILGTEHQSIFINPDPGIILNTLGTICDQPFADSSIIPSYLLAKAARNEVVVALGGDGGDEVFGGYDRYRALLRIEPFSAALRRIPFTVQFSRALGERLYRVSQMTKENSSERRYRSLLRNIHPNEYSGLINLKIFGRSVNENNLWNPLRKGELLRQMQEDDLSFYLPNDLMYKADMASMAVGLELRSPLLDYRIIEFGLSLPENLKVGSGFGKKILREIVAEYVPIELMNRPKKGFAIPRAEWLRGPLRDAASDLLFGNPTRNRGWFNTNVTKKIFERHLKGDDRDRILWSAITLELWARNWLD